MNTIKENQTVTQTSKVYSRNWTVRNATVKHIMERNGCTYGTCTINTIPFAIVKSGTAWTIYG